MTELIYGLLQQTGKPVAYQEYKSDKAEYIRFFYLPQSDVSADDDEIYNTVFVQVDWFTPYDPNPIAEQIKSLMKQAGFKKNFEHEVYEEDTSLFHYVLRFWITKEEK